MIDGDVQPGAKKHPSIALRCHHLVGRNQWLCRKPRQLAYYRQAYIHQYHLLVRSTIGIEGLMAAVEALDHPRNQLWGVHIDAIERHHDLKDLLAIAHV